MNQASLRKRLDSLERDAGSFAGECPRCSGVVEVTINGEFFEASKNGVSMSEEEYRNFEAADIDGRCPVCGERAIEVTGPPPHGEREGGV